MLKENLKKLGINQTIYRIYLELKGEVAILTPYNEINREITNQVLLVETVIVGTVPDTYLNMDEIDIIKQNEEE